MSDLRWCRLCGKFHPVEENWTSPPSRNTYYCLLIDPITRTAHEVLSARMSQKKLQEQK
jgi:hypothetical protein